MKSKVLSILLLIPGAAMAQELPTDPPEIVEPSKTTHDEIGVGFTIGVVGDNDGETQVGEAGLKRPTVEAKEKKTRALFVRAFFYKTKEIDE